MADGDGRVTPLLLHHQLRHRLADNIRPAEDDTFPAARLNIVAFQQSHDAQRRGRDEARQADGHAPDILGMEAIDILARVDGLNDFLLVDMPGQGQLHNEAVNVVVEV